MSVTQEQIAALTEALKDKPTGTETFEDMLLTHQAMAMEHLDKDRCLLRRDMKLSQNERFALGDDDKQKASDEMCEDSEMQVHIDRSRKVIHNHGGSQQPQPCPKPRPRPPWLWLLLIPILLLLFAFIIWLITQAFQPVAWELDIGADNPIEQSLQERSDASVPNVDPIDESGS